MADDKYGDAWRTFGEKLEEGRESLRRGKAERARFLDEFRDRLARHVEPAFREAAAAAARSSEFEVHVTSNTTHGIVLVVGVKDGVATVSAGHAGYYYEQSLRYRADADRRIVVVEHAPWAINKAGGPAEFEGMEELEVSALDGDRVEKTLTSFVRALRAPDETDR